MLKQNVLYIKGRRFWQTFFTPIHNSSYNLCSLYQNLNVFHSWQDIPLGSWHALPLIEHEWKCIIIVFITHLFFKDVQMISFKHHKAVSPYFPEYSFAAKPADPAYFVWLGWGLVGILKTLSVSTVTRLVCRLSYIIVFKFKQISVTRTMLSHHYVYSISVTTYIITISKLSNSDYIFFLLVLMCLFEVLKQFSYKFC